MIMESVLKQWKAFLKEGFTPEGKADLKYYAFDWDDNIVFMPTQIILIDTQGEEVGMSTHAFAQYRHLIGKQEFDYEGHKIANFATNPFRNFRVEGDQQFLSDISKAKLGPSFNDFKECVEGASLFAIITARGHTPSVLKEACADYIKTGFGGINKAECIKNIKQYLSLTNTQIPVEEMTEDQLIDEYLNHCQFSPVSHPSIAGTDTSAAASPEALKVAELNNFIEKAHREAKKIRKHAVKGAKIKVGFSDDDKKNIELMIAHFNPRDAAGRFKKGRRVRIKYTGTH